MSAPRAPSIGDLLAVDPALNSPGAALFRAGDLIAVERVKIDKDAADLPIGQRVARVAADIIRWVMERNAEPRYLVVEWPQIYDPTHQKASKRGTDPKDLLSLAGVCGALSGLLQLAVAQRNISLVVLSPTPREWAGQLPKYTRGDVKASPRAHRILSRLAAEEREIVPDSHDAIDAIGLGLHALGRLEVRRVYPGAVPRLVPDPE